MRALWASWFGVGACGLALALWAVHGGVGGNDYHTALGTLKFFTCLAAPFAFRDLASGLHENPKRALAFLLGIVVAHAAAALLFLPHRDAFAVRFSEDSVVWVTRATGLDAPNYAAWLRLIESRELFWMEIRLLATHYAIILGLAIYLPPRKWSAWVASFVGFYSWMLIPSFFGIVDNSHTMYLTGIFLDAVGINFTTPPLVSPNPAMVFFFAFFLLYFATALVSAWCWGNRIKTSETLNAPTAASAP